MEEKRWSLANIYPSVSSKEFLDDIDNVRKLSSKIIDSINSDSVVFSQLIKDVNTLYDISETLSSYTYCNYSVNTSDKDAVNALNKVEDLNVCLTTATNLFTTYVSNHQKEVDDFVNDNPSYRYIFSEISENAKHQMSKEMEELASDLMLSSSDSYERLQQTLSSSASADFDGEKKTVIELRALATHKDRKIREKAYKAELKVWKEHEISFAYALNSIKGTCLTLEKRRNYTSPIERSCMDSRINTKILDALISTIEKNLGMFRRYLKTKAKALNVDKLAFYDLFAPVGESETTYSLEDAKKIVQTNYGLFNPQMGVFAKNAFENGWIDPYPRSGKTGGAYDIYLPKVKESRVFANFDSTYDGVATFAHELGHAWHDHVISTKDALIRRYPMTLAETASIFSEFIVFNGALKNASDKDKLSLIEQFIQSACQVCVDILCRFYFEREVFERRKNGELMPDELCSIMIDCQKKTYGDGLDENYLHPWMWAVKGHYYSTGFSFYNYPYAFGQLFALGLYSMAQKDNDDKPFYEKYNNLLSLTGQMPAKDVANTAGIDLEDSSFWQEGLDIIASYERQFEELVK